MARSRYRSIERFDKPKTRGNPGSRQRQRRTGFDEPTERRTSHQPAPPDAGALGARARGWLAATARIGTSERWRGALGMLRSQCGAAAASVPSLASTCPGRWPAAVGRAARARAASLPLLALLALLGSVPRGGAQADDLVLDGSWLDGELEGACSAAYCQHRGVCYGWRGRDEASGSHLCRCRRPRPTCATPTPRTPPARTWTAPPSTTTANRMPR